ncbi:MAG: ATP-binding protein [Polyangiaceae bacterium]
MPIPATRPPSTPSLGPASAMVCVDQLPDGVLIVDGEGVVQGANQALLMLVERTREQVLGKRVDELLAEEDVLKMLGSDSLLRQESAHESSIIFSSGSGKPRPLLVSFARRADHAELLLIARAQGEVRNELQDASRWMAVEQERSQALKQATEALEAKQEELERAYLQLQDEVAVRERLENELRLAQKLEAVGQLAAGLAHEINTPMQYIGDNGSFLGSAIEQLSNFATSVRSAADSSASVEAFQQVIEESASTNDIDYLLDEAPRAVEALRTGVEQVSEIVRAMKSFARGDQSEKSPADLNQAIRDTLLVAHGEYKNVLSVVVDLGELPPVTCLISAMNQALLNLIVNATHAIVDAGRSGNGKIYVQSRVAGDSVQISVSDNGCGIPLEIQHRIFDQFFTTKPVGRGTGQGLAITRRIVIEMHGGTITFDSEAGSGSTFHIWIPIEPHERASS